MNWFTERYESERSSRIVAATRCAPIRRFETQGAVWPHPVVALHVFKKCPATVTRVRDDEVVEPFAAQCPDHALGDRLRGLLSTVLLPSLLDFSTKSRP